MCVLGGINKGAWMGYTNYTIDITHHRYNR
jgi:hypothetical protein